jgi:hypothetical protein
VLRIKTKALNLGLNQRYEKKWNPCHFIAQWNKMCMILRTCPLLFERSRRSLRIPHERCPSQTMSSGLGHSCRYVGLPSAPEI